VVMGLLLWAMGALWYDLPMGAGARKVVATLFIIGALALWFYRNGSRRLVVVGLLAGVMAWWFSQKPRDDRQWLADVDRTASVDVQGDVVTLRNVRNFEYRTETDYTPHWETRTVDLKDLEGIDMAITYWGSPYMSHPITCFRFKGGRPVCFSIETRKEVGESYSAIGGFYRQYELIYLVADERDVVRLRTNYRKGEEVYLYRLAITPEQARGRFMDYVRAVNELTTKPRWYNAATANCTTSIRTQHDAKKRSPWDWRILLNGKGDEMLYERGALVTAGLPFAELKRRSLVNDAARAADTDPDFSTRIRANGPSFLGGDR
ncbi:MAG: DUF4105 domain-containing protein, partial [Verrucomicrobiaceae bacterium]